MRLNPGTTKNKKGREVHLTPELLDLFRKLYDESRAIAEKRGQSVPWVFHWSNGNPARDFRGTWNAACKAVNVPNLLFHDLRRSCVRRMEQAGIPRSVAMQITGHRTESVYRRYAIVDDEAMAEATRRLANLTGTGAGTGSVENVTPDFAHHRNSLT
ncbi:MAG TPA: tyrosine-type recombinase/integrase [Candidatus Acidoferrum sp.]|nr:tyrosine-type recombinase/integrase [Candidatus Acidoferrum sp.]